MLWATKYFVHCVEIRIDVHNNYNKLSKLNHKIIFVVHIYGCFVFVEKIQILFIALLLNAVIHCWLRKCSAG